MRKLLLILLLFGLKLNAQVAASLQLAGGDNAWHAARPTATPLPRQMVLNTTTGQYKIGDGVTQLQNLPYYSGVLTGSYVPYSGATTSVNLGAQNLSTTGNVGLGSTTITSANQALTITDGTINAGVYLLNSATSSSVYNGPWIGSFSKKPVHFVSGITAGGLPAISITSLTSGAVNGVLINGPTTFTTTAQLDVYDGGGINNFRTATASNNETFRIEKTTGDVYLKGRSVVGSTVSSTTHTLSVNGGANITSTLSVGGGGTVITGNSGTVAVLTDNYFTLTTTFNIQALSASTTYYWSTNHGLGVRTTVNQSAEKIPYNCTLVGASITAWNAGSSTSQTNSTLNFRVNNTTDNVVTSALLWNTGSCNNCGINSTVTNLNVSLTAGDTWENKLVIGALATPPNNGNVTVTYYFARR